MEVDFRRAVSLHQEPTFLEREAAGVQCSVQVDGRVSAEDTWHVFLVQL